MQTLATHVTARWLALIPFASITLVLFWSWD